MALLTRRSASPARSSACCWLALERRRRGPGARQRLGGAVRPPGAGLPDFRLTDQDGRTVTAASPARAGRWSSPSSTPLPGHLPGGGADASAARSTTSGTTCRSTASPSTPPTTRRARAQAFLLEQKMKGRMEFLLGSRAQPRRAVWKAFGIAPQAKGRSTRPTSCSSTRQGRQRVGFPFDQLTQAGLAPRPRPARPRGVERPRRAGVRRQPGGATSSGARGVRARPRGGRAAHAPRRAARLGQDAARRRAGAPDRPPRARARAQLGGPGQWLRAVRQFGARRTCARTAGPQPALPIAC